MNTPIDFGYRREHKMIPAFHSHPEYEIYYFHRGRSNYLIGDRIYTLSPGDLIIMHGMTLHCAKVYEHLDYVRTVIHFNPSFVLEFARHFPGVRLLQPFEELKNHRLNLKGKTRAEFEQLLCRMNRLAQRRDGISRHRFSLLFVDLLLFIHPLFRQTMADRNEFPSEKEKNVQNIVSFLDQHYMEDLNLDLLEKKLHMSKYYLSKIFKEVTGVTIFDYLYQRRINQAKVLFLMEKERTATEVCYQVGFKHLAHFSRMFKARVGLTPEQFKRQMHEKTGNREMERP